MKLELAASALAFACLASAAVRPVPEKKLFLLETTRTTYAVGVNNQGILQHLYWGRKLRAEDFEAARTAGGFAFESSEGLTSEEYPAWGGMRYAEPALKATFADGNRDLVLKYVSHTVDGETLTLRVKDVSQELYADLVYRVYPAVDIVRRHVKIDNRTGGVVTLEAAHSAVWYVPAGTGYRLSHLTGRWAGETQLTQDVLTTGKKVLESRRGNTSHQANPWFALDRGATETEGRVWFGALAWSGNWKFVAEQTPYGQVRLAGGMNDFDFAYTLKPGESLETPPFYGGFTDRGFGESSRLMHRLVRTELLPDRAAPRPRPVLYNSWEATTFSVTEQGQRELADKAAKLGIEMFVMDDGWFGARKDDKAGLGDWVVNREKFPNGLKPLIDHVNKLGMKFGLWVEPEMVNPDSDLYRAHPDWAIHMPGRPRTEGRNQLILNMARSDVKEHMFGVLDKLLTENPKIEFIKWDMNRHVTEPGWPSVPAPEQKEIWVHYVRNVYDIFARLRAKHPNLEIESCSGGGGRIDLGILPLVDQVWTSDNTEAFDRLRIQEGFTYAYAPKAMMDWVTDVPNLNGRSTSLKYRFLVAMAGSLGIGANLNHWKAEDEKTAAEMIALYKSIRNTVQMGDLYRLLSPRTENVSATQFVSADGRQSVVFAYLHSQQFLTPAPALYLQGLDENALYKVRGIDDKLLTRPAVLSGAALMSRGINVRLTGDFDATAVILERQ